MQVKLNGSFVNYETLLPDSLQTNFPELKALGTVKQAATAGPAEFLDSILQKIKLVRLSQYIDYKPPRVQRHSGEAHAYPHPSFFSSAIYGNELYIFNRRDVPGATTVANRLLERLGVSVSSAEEARQVAEFFILLYSEDFKTAGLMISSVQEVPEKYRSERREAAERLGSVIKRLHVDRQDNQYVVEFFTWEYLPCGEVIRWQIKVSPAGQLFVTQQVAGLL
jgi:hypothetical protein